MFSKQIIWSNNAYMLVSAFNQVHDCVPVALADRKVQPPFYQYTDLKAATRGFHKDNKLGHGGFGVVYKVRINFFSGINVT
jgi:hypothetical protein